MLNAAHRLRYGRHSEINQIYLLTSVTRARTPVFLDFQLARLLVSELCRLQQRGAVISLAWVVMPDHLHWLVQLQNGDLASLMRELKSRSARRINAHTGSAQPLWQHGYHDHALRSDEDLLATARYVVANPLRAGLVRRLGDYPHWDAIWV